MANIAVTPEQLQATGSQRSSRGIQEALHGISHLTQQAGTNYADTEQGIASNFGR